MDENIKSHLERLEHILPLVFRQLEQEVRRTGEGELSWAQRTVLSLLSRQDTATMSELSKTLGITMGSTTTLIDRLCKDGLVIRYRSTSDRRVVLVETTESGKQAFFVSKQRRLAKLGKYLARLDPTDVADFMRVIEKLAQAMQHNPISEGKVND